MASFRDPEARAARDAEVDEAVLNAAHASAWMETNGNECADDNGISDLGEIAVDSRTQPYLMAQSIVAHWFRQKPTGQPGDHGAMCLTLRRWQCTWMRHNGRSWDALSDEMAEALVVEAIKRCYQTLVNEETGAVRQAFVLPTTELVNGVVKMLKAKVILDDEKALNTWLKAPYRGMDAQVIPVENGLLAVPERVLYPHTPGYFNACCSPLAYDAAARCPRWMRFLEEIFPGDLASQRLLQEIIGYILSGRTDLQKMFLLVGKKRGGKGTIARVIKWLVGEANVASPSLASLVSDFGLQPLLGKTLGVIGDARLDDKVDVKAVERMLSISGEDSVPVNRKNKSFLDVKLPIRLMALSNVLPNFKDESGALASRFVTLVFTQSFFGREDTTLDQKLREELPGILNWALDGLDRLNEQGRFTKPERSGAVERQLQTINASVVTFVESCTENTDEVLTSDLFWAYHHWMRDQGLPLPFDPLNERELNQALSRFGKSIVTNMPFIMKVRGSKARYGESRPYVYRGISLMPHLRSDAVTRPSWTR